MKSLNELKKRTRNFGIRVIKMIDHLPNNSCSEYYCKPSCSLSNFNVGANYREACQSEIEQRSLFQKLGISEGEADETLYWLEIIIESLN